MTKPSWMGCVGLPYTLDLWLHQTKHLQCEDMTLFYERTDKVVATCGNRRDGAIVRDGRRSRSAVGASAPRSNARTRKKRYRLSSRT
jgi:hypothetical protein